MTPKQAISLANKIDKDGFDVEDVDKLTEAVRCFAKLVQEAPTFFHPVYDFDGDKLKWLERAGLVA